MNAQLQRLAAIFITAYLALAGLLGWWGLVRAEALTSRLDNLRRGLADQRALRGQITDRNGVVLAASIGEFGSYQRIYPVPAAAPVVGYNSALYGQAGLEAALDPILTGRVGRDPSRAWHENLLYGGPVAGYDVQLTLDAAVQQAAFEAIAPEHGALVLLDVHSGDVLALVSSPTFDPGRLDENWEQLRNDPAAALFNRAAQGQYTPGGVIQPVVMAAAIQAGLAGPTDLYPDAAAAVQVDGQFAECAVTTQTPSSNSPPTLAQAFALGCPSPFADLGEALGPQRLLQSLEDFRLFEPVPFVLPVDEPALFALLPSDLRLEAIGQGRLAVSPLRMALIAAAFANQGKMPSLWLVARSESAAGPQPFPAPPGPERLLRGDAASEVAALMTEVGETEIGRLAGMPEANVAGHFAAALTGRSGEKLGWFIGYAPVDDPRYALAVVLEDGSPQAAAMIGTKVLSLATALIP